MEQATCWFKQYFIGKYKVINGAYTCSGELVRVLIVKDKLTNSLEYLMYSNILTWCGLLGLLGTKISSYLLGKGGYVFGSVG